MNAVQKSKRTIQTVEIGVGELGFTLIELLISSTLALVLMLTTTTILFQYHHGYNPSTLLVL